MTPGENELAQRIGELSVTNARLLNQCQQLELHAASIEERYREVTEVLTNAQRVKLGLDLDSK
jgi:hypothetical protein